MQQNNVIDRTDRQGLEKKEMNHLVKRELWRHI